MQKKDLDLEKLKDLYENHDLTIKEIADEMECSPSLVKIKARHLKLKKFSNFSFLTKEFLEDLYINQNLSMTQISKKLNIGRGAVQMYVEKYKLKKGDSSYKIDKDLLKKYVEKGLTITEISKKFGCSDSVIRGRIKTYGIKFERRKYDINPEELKDLYVNKKMSMRKIAQKFGCSDIIIRIRLKELGLRDEKGKERLQVDEDKLRDCIERRGLTYKEAAQEMGLKVNTVANRARKLGLKKPISKLALATYEELYDLYITKNLSEVEIGKMYKMGGKSVSRKLVELGINENMREFPTFTDEKLIYLYVEEGLNQRETAEELGVPERLVKERIDKLHMRRLSPWVHITDDTLREMYVEKGMNIPEIVKELQVPTSVISSRIYRLNLTAERDPEEHIKSVHRSYQNSVTRSKGEIEIEEMYPTKFINDHDTIGWELDLWYPEKRVAVEYNGEYWHSSALRKPGKHIAKASLCDNKQIHLINIFERFWKNKEMKAKVVNILSNNLAPEKLKKVVGEIREVSPEEAQEFIRKNNIEKVVSADWHIGTFSGEGTLLNMLSLKDEGYTAVIRRFTTKIGYKEDYKKLMEYLKKDEKILFIKVACDRSYYNGSLFTSLGFKIVGNTKPEYEYVWGDKVISRTTYNKTLEKYQKYYKVYDCGKVKLQWER